jgi:hypothetical protein
MYKDSIDDLLSSGSSGPINKTYLSASQEFSKADLEFDHREEGGSCYVNKFNPSTLVKIFDKGVVPDIEKIKKIQNAVNNARKRKNNRYKLVQFHKIYEVFHARHQDVYFIIMDAIKPPPAIVVPSKDEPRKYNVTKQAEAEEASEEESEEEAPGPKAPGPKAPEIKKPEEAPGPKAPEIKKPEEAPGPKAPEIKKPEEEESKVKGFDPRKPEFDQETKAFIEYLTRRKTAEKRIDLTLSLDQLFYGTKESNDKPRWYIRDYSPFYKTRTADQISQIEIRKNYEIQRKEKEEAAAEKLKQDIDDWAKRQAEEQKIAKELRKIEKARLDKDFSVDIRKPASKTPESAWIYPIAAINVHPRAYTSNIDTGQSLFITPMFATREQPITYKPKIDVPQIEWKNPMPIFNPTSSTYTPKFVADQSLFITPMFATRGQPIPKPSPPTQGGFMYPMLSGGTPKPFVYNPKPAPVYYPTSPPTPPPNPSSGGSGPASKKSTALPLVASSISEYIEKYADQCYLTSTTANPDYEILPYDYLWQYIQNNDIPEKLDYRSTDPQKCANDDEATNLLLALEDWMNLQSEIEICPCIFEYDSKQNTVHYNYPEEHINAKPLTKKQDKKIDSLLIQMIMLPYFPTGAFYEIKGETFFGKFTNLEYVPSPYARAKKILEKYGDFMTNGLKVKMKKLTNKINLGALGFNPNPDYQFKDGQIADYSIELSLLDEVKVFTYTRSMKDYHTILDPEDFETGVYESGDTKIQKTLAGFMQHGYNIESTQIKKTDKGDKYLFYLQEHDSFEKPYNLPDGKLGEDVKAVIESKDWQFYTDGKNIFTPKHQRFFTPPEDIFRYIWKGKKIKNEIYFNPGCPRLCYHTVDSTKFRPVEEFYMDILDKLSYLQQPELDASVTYITHEEPGSDPAKTIKGSHSTWLVSKIDAITSQKLLAGFGTIDAIQTIHPTDKSNLIIDFFYANGAIRYTKPCVGYHMGRLIDPYALRVEDMDADTLEMIVKNHYMNLGPLFYFGHSKVQYDEFLKKSEMDGVTYADHLMSFTGRIYELKDDIKPIEVPKPEAEIEFEKTLVTPSAEPPIPDASKVPPPAETPEEV